ncbi:NAD(P)H-dependent oxidoreductase [Vreelandella titanicae]|uniref:NAD(P)H-dependent oxidoreductase n=1 Tax=Vreelandella titanicae TaxID=664683 RepID=UPI0038194029|tara:strand:- start:758 stop:1354 length:597 start_codon:yes stop_codon:yes gene_type:complete
MNCLVVKAHPLSESLCSSLAQRTIKALEAAGHSVEVEDLYAHEFAASLTGSERRSYYAGSYTAQQVAPQVERLLAAEAIVLVFPTWWFGFPAILKGWFDRVWAPGIAYDHADQYGPIKPRLTNLHHMLAVTSLGSPWWVDKFVLRQPVKRVLKTAIVGTCAPKCRLQMLSLYKSEQLSPTQVEQFGGRVERALQGWLL